MSQEASSVTDAGQQDHSLILVRNIGQFLGIAGARVVRMFLRVKCRAAVLQG